MVLHVCHVLFDGMEGSLRPHLICPPHMHPRERGNTWVRPIVRPREKAIQGQQRKGEIKQNFPQFVFNWCLKVLHLSSENASHYVPVCGQKEGGIKRRACAREIDTGRWLRPLGLPVDAKVDVSGDWLLEQSESVSRSFSLSPGRTCWVLGALTHCGTTKEYDLSLHTHTQTHIQTCQRQCSLHLGFSTS